MLRVPAVLSAVLALASTSGQLDADPLAGVVAWGELAAAPQEHLGARVRVVLQVHSVEEDWNPFLSRFAPGEFLALRAWTDEQEPWVEADWQAPRARVFVRRGGRLEQRVRLLQRHERLLLTCVVRELVAGGVWAEALDLDPLFEYVPEGTVLHAIRGLTALENGAPRRARQEFERALAAPIPAGARRALEALKARSTPR